MSLCPFFGFGLCLGIIEREKGNFEVRVFDSSGFQNMKIEVNYKKRENKARELIFLKFIQQDLMLVDNSGVEFAGN